MFDRVFAVSWDTKGILKENYRTLMSSPDVCVKNYIREFCHKKMKKCLKMKKKLCYKYMLNLFHRKISMKEDFVPQNPKSYLHPHMLYFVIVLQTYFPLFWLHIHWMFLTLPAIPCHCQMYPEIGGALPAPSRSTKFFVKKIFFYFSETL